MFRRELKDDRSRSPFDTATPADLADRCIAARAHPRRAAILVLSAVLLVGLVAFTIDVGSMFLVRTRLQVAADAAAIAAGSRLSESREEVLATAKQYAQLKSADHQPIELRSRDIELGLWDNDDHRFTPTTGFGNSVKVTARRDSTADGEAPLFLARILGLDSFEMQASAVTMTNPRDIVFVVDLSGSMNNDSEPCWATDGINAAFGGRGYANVGSQLMQDVFDDFGYGPYPGTLRHIGKGLVNEDQDAYINLTADNGPLTESTIPSVYRISSHDSQATRKRKCYSALIDLSIARVMPAAKPTPNSSLNYAYWAKYLDYVIEPMSSGRTRLPPNQDVDRIERFSNVTSTFGSSSSSIVHSHCNMIGYKTYVQFMMDHGRDLKPDGSTYVPLSQFSPDCPWHEEDTPAGTFRFPPSEQPTHAARRSLIAAMQIVKERNAGVPDPRQRDWVSLITFDSLNQGRPVVRQSLTWDYYSAMVASTKIQAVGDKGGSTATESGLIEARNHIRPASQGGRGREGTDKIIVLLTDGAPNLYSSNRSTIGDFISNNPSDNFYSSNKYAHNAALMQSTKLRDDHWRVYPVGIGLGTDYDFMDRMARMGGTANDAGQSPRGSGNPAEYEQRLIDIFENIITNPQVRLVQ